MRLTLVDLKEVWDRQAGVCPLTGWALDNPRATSAAHFEFHSRRASLDRIDSSMGYVHGNVRFVALIAQYAKNSFSDADLIEFCRSVVRHQAGMTSSILVASM